MTAFNHIQQANNAAQGGQAGARVGADQNVDNQI